MNLVFIGPQGSGKGTQAKIVAEKLGYVHLSVGELFREEIKKETDQGKFIASLIDKGELVPDEFTSEFVSKIVNQINNEGKKIILDGYPRNVYQGKFSLENFNIDKVILIDIPEDITIKRLSARQHCPNCKKEYNSFYQSLNPKNEGVCDVCGSKLERRKDDNPDAIKKRLQIYTDETLPLIDLFKEKLIKIDGTNSIEEVTKSILDKL